MGFAEAVANWSEKRKERLSKFKDIEENTRFNKIVTERQKSANERELEGYLSEDREKIIKGRLEVAKKQRVNAIKNANPLTVKNITRDSGNSVLKSRSVLGNNKDSFLKKGNLGLIR